MTPAELRIGNLVDYNGEIIEVDLIDSLRETINNPENDCESGISISDLKPILLTEELLLKFGFEKYDWFDGCFIKCNNKHLMIQFYEPKQEILIYFTKISKDKDGHKMNGRDYLFKLNKYYANQLQNLYFCLCGKELELSNQNVM